MSLYLVALTVVFWSLMLMLSSLSTAGTHRPSREPVSVRRPLRRLELRHLHDRDLDRPVSVRDLADAVRATQAGRRRGRADAAAQHLLADLRGLHQSDVRGLKLKAPT